MNSIPMTADGLKLQYAFACEREAICQRNAREAVAARAEAVRERKAAFQRWREAERRERLHSDYLGGKRQ